MRTLCSIVVLCIALQGRVTQAAAPALTNAVGLYKLCKAELGSSEREFCFVLLTGYTSGIYSMINSVSSRRCILPNYFGALDLMGTFIGFMEALPPNDDLTSAPANEVLFKSLVQKYPCIGK